MFIHSSDVECCSSILPFDANRPLNQIQKKTSNNISRISLLHFCWIKVIVISLTKHTDEKYYSIFNVYYYICNDITLDGGILSLIVGGYCYTNIENWWSRKLSFRMRLYSSNELHPYIGCQNQFSFILKFVGLQIIFYESSARVYVL